jgi:hypothetical protein
VLAKTKCAKCALAFFTMNANLKIYPVAYFKLNYSLHANTIPNKIHNQPHRDIRSSAGQRTVEFIRGDFMSWVVL